MNESIILKKITKNLLMLDFYLNYHFFLKNVENSVNINSQKNCHSFQKDQEKLKKISNTKNYATIL